MRWAAAARTRMEPEGCLVQLQAFCCSRNLGSPMQCAVMKPITHSPIQLEFIPEQLVTKGESESPRVRLRPSSVRYLPTCEAPACETHSQRRAAGKRVPPSS
eukprot:COSAG01_NODE_33596_length_561_cov_2.989177_1_plen_101_part_10